VSLTAEQMAARLNKIGGSIAAQVLGVSKYGGPLDAYLRIRQLAEVEPNEAMDWGLILEEPVAQEWARRHGFEVRCCDETHANPAYPWAIASPDRLVVGRREGLEVKTIGEWSARELLGPSGEIEPLPDHFIQVLHYLAVLDLRRWWLACLVGGNRLVEFVFERDGAEPVDPGDAMVIHVSEALVVSVMEREREFYEKHILPAEAPPHTSAKDPNAALAALYPQHVALKEAEPTEALRDALLSLGAARLTLRDSTQRVADRAADVKALMQDAERADFDFCRVTWRTNRRGSRVFRPVFFDEPTEAEELSA
jgi:putative phage-type endonuclease